MKLPLLFLISASLSALDIAPVEKARQREMASLRIPGAAMVIVEHGKPLRVKGYGARPVDDAIAVNEKTLFRLGSTARLFTSPAALQCKAGACTIPVQELGDNFYRAPGGAQMERFRMIRDASGKPDYLCAEVWRLKRQ